MKLYIFIRRRIAVSAKKDGFKQHCFKQPCLICFLLSLQKKKSLQQKYMKIKDILGMLKGFYDELLEHSQCLLYDRSHVIILVFGKATAKDNLFLLICQVLILSV